MLRFLTGAMLVGTDPCDLNTFPKKSVWAVDGVNYQFYNRPGESGPPNPINGEWQITVDGQNATYQGIGRIGPSGDDGWLHINGQAHKCVAVVSEILSCDGKGQAGVPAELLSVCTLPEGWA